MVSCILHWAPVQFSSVHWTALDCSAESFPQQMQKHQKVPRPRCCSYEPGQGRHKFLSTIYIPTINHNVFLSPVADTDVIFIALTRNLWLGCGWIIPWIFIARLWRRFLYLLSWIRVFVEKPSVTSPCHPFQWRAVNSNFDECIITSSVTPPTFNSLRGNIINQHSHKLKNK